VAKGFLAVNNAWSTPLRRPMSTRASVVLAAVLLGVW
jgi:hypothetical protein